MLSKGENSPFSTLRHRLEPRRRAQARSSKLRLEPPARCAGRAGIDQRRAGRGRVGTGHALASPTAARRSARRAWGARGAGAHRPAGADHRGPALPAGRGARRAARQLAAATSTPTKPPRCALQDEAVSPEATHGTLFDSIGQGWVSGAAYRSPRRPSPRRASISLLDSASARPRRGCWRRSRSAWSALLPAGWRVDGTTGYYFWALSLGLFVIPQDCASWKPAGKSFPASRGGAGASRRRQTACLARIARARSGPHWRGARLPRASARNSTRRSWRRSRSLVVGLRAGRTLLEGGAAQRRGRACAARRGRCGHRPTARLGELAQRRG